jgi:hypothetical protein
MEGPLLRYPDRTSKVKPLPHYETFPDVGGNLLDHTDSRMADSLLQFKFTNEKCASIQYLTNFDWIEIFNNFVAQISISSASKCEIWV